MRWTTFLIIVTVILLDGRGAPSFGQEPPPAGADVPAESLSEPGSDLAAAEQDGTAPMEDLERLLNTDIGELDEVQIDPFRSGPNEGNFGGAEFQASADANTANVVGGHEADTRNTTDAGNLLGRSHQSPGTYLQQRNPIITDPRIRGYRSGQYLVNADGAFWTPARSDLDSVTSKLDSRLIEGVVVVNGPYSARYGPGFAFVDFATIRTPRFEDGSNWEGASSLNYNGNGQQWSGSQLFRWGNEDSGYSVFYGHLTGSDYLDGAGRKVPSSYNSRNLHASLGYDVGDSSSLEFRYLRQDQTGVELAGQYTDIDFLITDGFVANWRTTDQPYFDNLAFDAWYNRTRAEGSGGSPSKQALYNSVFNAPSPGGFITLPRGGSTDFDVMSIGYRLSLAWGEAESGQLTLGHDLRHVEQGLNETQTRPTGTGAFRTGTESVFALLPRSESTNPGLFAEWQAPVADRWTIRTGARADWVDVQAGAGRITRRGGVGAPLDVLGPDRDNSYTLWSAFVTGEYQLTEETTAEIGFGMAQRPPTLTELYAMRPFESVLQQGLNRVQGYPFLAPERLKQIDVGLHTDVGRARGGVRGFHAWISDYITSQGISVDPTSTSARITSVYVNTPRATLLGGEAFGEYDWDESRTWFATAMYVQGTNETLNQRLFGTSSLPVPPGSSSGALFGRGAFSQAPGEEALPQIPPLEVRLGLRWHEAVFDPAWGTEFTVRMVDSQDRVASGSLLERPTPGFTTVDCRGYWKPYGDVTLIAGVLNLLDKTYREHLDNRAGNQLFQPGISGYVGCEWTY